jgi:adhesin transport system membrane fusion protein
MAWWFSRAKTANALQQGDLRYVGAVHSALVVEAAPGAIWSVYLMAAALVAAFIWAAVAQVDIVARATGRVIPDGREQVINSLEGGILRELKVREGQPVEAGQELALLDPTRVEAQQAESLAKRSALRATIARLTAEATGKPLDFPADVKTNRGVVEGETDAYNARQHALNEAVALNRRSIALLGRELNVAESMSAKGLMSEVEVMRLRRQVNDLNLQVQERSNRFRQEASSELVKVRTELSLLEEQLVVRDDMLRRTTLKSPVRGIVKTIKTNTLGGVVSPGATLMEIVPMGQRLLMEARIRPSDIGFVRVGQQVVIKFSAYEYAIYGGLKGEVQTISPDVLTDGDRNPGTGDSSYYRALVRADTPHLQAGTRELPLLPGMTATVDIRTGQRSVLAYLLLPLRKSQEAFRER